MINEEKILKLVLNDPVLKSEFKTNFDQNMTIDDAIKSENPITSCIGKIIKGSSGPSKISRKDLYTEIYNNLNSNLI